MSDKIEWHVPFLDGGLIWMMKAFELKLLSNTLSPRADLELAILIQILN